MKNKVKRFAAIQEIISTSIVGSQEELLQRLSAQGFELTQATLSRDLKQLKVAKAATMGGNYIYVIKYKDIDGKEHIDKGQLLLIR